MMPASSPSWVAHTQARPAFGVRHILTIARLPVCLTMPLLKGGTADQGGQRASEPRIFIFKTNNRRNESAFPGQCAVSSRALRTTAHYSSLTPLTPSWPGRPEASACREHSLHVPLQFSRRGVSSATCGMCWSHYNPRSLGAEGFLGRNSHRSDLNTTYCAKYTRATDSCSMNSAEAGGGQHL